MTLPDHRQIVARLKRAQRSHDRLGRDPRVLVAGQDLGLRADDQHSLEPEPAEAMELALETFLVLSHATADKVADRLAFHGEQALNPGRRVVAAR